MLQEENLTISQLIGKGDQVIRILLNQAFGGNCTLDDKEIGLKLIEQLFVWHPRFESTQEVESAFYIGQEISETFGDDGLKIRVFLFHCEILLQTIGNDRNPSFAPIIAQQLNV